MRQLHHSRDHEVREYFGEVTGRDRERSFLLTLRKYEDGVWRIMVRGGSVSGPVCETTSERHARKEYVLLASNAEDQEAEAMYHE
jgi:hypothetical protein